MDDKLELKVKDDGIWENFARGGREGDQRCKGGKS